MKSKSVGFWRGLEAVPGLAAVEVEWKMRFGVEYESARVFTNPNGGQASSYPCIIPRGCGCYHDVVIHDSDDIVAVCHCERGCATIALTRSDLVVYAVDRTALGSALAKAFGLHMEIDRVTDLPKTTRLGDYSPSSGCRFPVYLTIQVEPHNFGEVVDGLLARDSAPFILLTPTLELCSAKTERRLADRRSGIVSLLENAELAERGIIRLLRPIAEILTQFSVANQFSLNGNFESSHLPAPSTKARELPDDAILIERKNFDEGVHWVVNGVDKGRFFERTDTKKAKIIEILYDQIGRGWVLHITFINATGWSKEEYFPSLDNPGRMQRQLTELRNFLEIDIEFRKDKGVRLSEKVVKSG